MPSGVETLLDFSPMVEEGLCQRTLLTSALLRTRSATTSGWLFFHGEDIVKIEDSRPSSGHSSGSESISERSRGATPRQTVEIVWFVGRAKGRRLSEKVEGFAQVFEVGHGRGGGLKENEVKEFVLRL